jgi:hypothetical protein
MNGLQSSMQGRRFQWLDPKPLPEKYRTLVRDQGAIGWYQAFRARMSSEWARLEEEYTLIQTIQRTKMSLTNHEADTLSRAQGKHCTGGIQWLSEIIAEIWRQWDAIWSIRNRLLHRIDRTSWAQSCQREKDQHGSHSNNRQQFKPQVEELLYDTIADHITYHSWDAIHKWLAVHKSTFIQSIQTFKQEMGNLRSSLVNTLVFLNGTATSRWLR